MPSNKKPSEKVKRPDTRVSVRADFAKVLRSTKKPRVKPVDRGMVFISYLMEQEITGHVKSKRTGSSKPKPRT